MPSPTPSYPTDDLPSGAPATLRLLGEVATAREPLRLGLASPRLLRAPRGDGRVVLALPGWLASGSSMLPIRTFLRRRGHDAQDWGLGVNGGDVEALVEAFLVVLESRIAAGDGRAAHLVGWSLGGVIAREAARGRPDLVERVVVFGSPIIGGPSHTVGARRYGPQECARVAELQAGYDLERPVSTPLLSIFTKRDGIVDWRACIDRASLGAEHLEVSSTHLGLGLDPDVWLAAARFLAAEPL